MGTKGDTNRQRIVEAADQLFYKRGYNQTSFRDISDVTGIPRGNFYYYFKTKDEILDAVVDSRLTDIRAFIYSCDSTHTTPHARLSAFIDMLETKKQQVIDYGCPIGTLSLELAKDDDSLRLTALAVFEMTRDWLAQQFSELGLDNAEDKAMDLLARLQGISVMGCAFKDARFLKRSHREIRDWLNKLTLS